jgi:hypothetical protein
MDILYVLLDLENKTLAFPRVVPTLMTALRLPLQPSSTAV